MGSDSPRQIGIIFNQLLGIVQERSLAVIVVQQLGILLELDVDILLLFGIVAQHRIDEARQLDCNG